MLGLSRVRSIEKSDIEAAERFTADPFLEILEDCGRILADFGRASGGLRQDLGGLRQDFGRRSAGSGSPGLILVGKSQILEGIWWLGPVLASVLPWWLARR